jgi:hypothetical protein
MGKRQPMMPVYRPIFRCRTLHILSVYSPCHWPAVEADVDPEQGPGGT